MAADSEVLVLVLLVVLFTVLITVLIAVLNAVLISVIGDLNAAAAAMTDLEAALALSAALATMTAAVLISKSAFLLTFCSKSG